jgi:hypothetical protein
MRYFYFLFSALIFAALSANAQSNFKPGYILKANQDTLRGFIDYREWQHNPSQVTFKTSLSATTQKITAGNSEGFGVDGAEYYIRGTVKVSSSAISLPDVKETIDTASTLNNVFLKQLVQGSKVSLYEFADELKARFYILDRSSKDITPLNQYVYIDHESKNLTTVRPYVSQLLRVLNQYQPDSKKLQYAITRSNYNERDLSRIVIDLNGGVADQQVVTQNAATRLFIGAGVLRNRLEFSGPDAYVPFVNGMGITSITGVLTGGVDFITNKNTEALVIRVEATASYSPFKFEEPNNNQRVRHRLDLKQGSVALIPQLLTTFTEPINSKHLLA